MSWRKLLNVIGAVVAATGAAMLVPTIAALVYREWDTAAWILAAAAVTTLTGLGAWQTFDRPGELTGREGFAAVGLSWMAMSLFGMLPYLLTGELSDLSHAFFETASGFSTTGASVVPDPGALSHGILMWRGLTQWMGGMGIIVLSVAILPLLGVGGVQLARAESPGHIPDRLTPRFRETAKRLWLIYLALSLLEAAALTVAGMTLFESVVHTMTTMSTGGFGTHVLSLTTFSPAAQWIVIVFMVLAGASFTLHLRSLKRPRAYADSAEFRLYILILVGASAVAVIGTLGGYEEVRHAIFTVVSIVTTTGFATTDFGLWAPALQVLILGLMFVGGMSGSTAGAVKPYRLGVLYSASRADLRRVIHPRGLFLTRLGRDPVAEPVVESVQAFFLLYMYIFMTGTLLLAIFGAIYGADLDVITSASAVASSLGNVGPGLGAVGPSSNYLAVPWPGKILLSMLMIVGRLEVFPILLLFTRELWRR